MLLTISYSELANPITTQYQLKARFLDNFEISINSVYYIFIRTIYDVKFTYEKLKSVKFGLRILDYL